MPKKHYHADPYKTGVAYVQVLGLGTDTADTVPSVLLFFEHQRLLFNAGEGFQRFCTQHKVKMTKLSSVLATRMSTEALGGVPGMLLTMADAKPNTSNVVTSGQVTMTLYGPPGITKLYNAMRTFINVRDLGLRAVEFQGVLEQPAIITDPMFAITPVVLSAEEKQGEAPPAKRPKTAAATPDAPTPCDPTQGHEDGQVRDGEVLVEEHEAVAVCYVVQLADVRGKFDPKRAQALGVPKGPMFGQLQRGASVTTPEGRTVTPEEVLGASTPGPITSIVDCPTAAFLPSLLASPTFTHLQQSAHVLVHLTPPDVLANPTYHAWMQRFGPHAHHIIVHHPTAHHSIGLLSSAILQAQLHSLDTSIFPMPPLHAPTPTPDAGSPSSSTTTTMPEGALAGLSLSRYTLLPVRKMQFETGARSGCAFGVDLLPETARVAVENARALLTEVDQHAVDQQNTAAAASVSSTPTGTVPPCIANASDRDVELVFLGTGAAIPSKYRNVTGMYLHMFDRGGMMVDCGEGSLGQLRRRFGVACDDIVANLQAVWISHIHADHHVGLPRLLNARKQLLGHDCPPLLVIGPRPLRRALLAYAQLEPMTFRYIDCANLVHPDHQADTPTPPQDPTDTTTTTDAHALPPNQITTILQPIKHALNLASLHTFPVVHCRHSYGLSVQGNGGWKIVFSGDTRPCEAVVKAAQGATLLVHEATFEDGLEGEAVTKKHSTVSDAVTTGIKAGCYRTILTHFSQRYPKIPVLPGSDESSQESSSVAIAFDLMSVNLKDLPRLPTLVPALQKLFEDNEHEVEEEEI